jgi:hypothetical protein
MKLSQIETHEFSSFFRDTCSRLLSMQVEYFQGPQYGCDQYPYSKLTRDILILLMVLISNNTSSPCSVELSSDSSIFFCIERIAAGFAMSSKNANRF